MSRPSIKFVYSGEIRSEVQELQKGPVPLDNFYGSFMRPQSPPPVIIPSPHPVVSCVEVNSKTTIPTISRHKSSDSIVLPRNNETQFSPFLNIGEVQESRMQPSQKPPMPEPKKASKSQNQQIVLKAPCYKFTPKGEGELTVRSKKQYNKVSSVEKPLNGQNNLRSKRKGAPQGQSEKQMQLKTSNALLMVSNALLMVEAVKESDFAAEPDAQIIPPKQKNSSSSQANRQPAGFEDQIVLKAPKYKYTPKEGATRKKEYVKAENSEKYLYQGVKNHQENDFIGCFGCAKPNAKVYANNEEE